MNSLLFRFYHFLPGEDTLTAGGAIDVSIVVSIDH